MKVLNSWCVLVIEFLVEKPGDDSCLANFCGAQDNHSVTVLCRNVKLVLGWRHFLDHACTQKPRNIKAEFSFFCCCSEVLCTLLLWVDDGDDWIYSRRQPLPQPRHPLRIKWRENVVIRVPTQRSCFCVSLPGPSLSKGRTNFSNVVSIFFKNQMLYLVYLMRMRYVCTNHIQLGYFSLTSDTQFIFLSDVIS